MARMRKCVALGLLSLALLVTVEGYYSTARSCWGCNRCTARPCRRRMNLLEFLMDDQDPEEVAKTSETIDMVLLHRHLDSTPVASPVIPCSNENEYCDGLYQYYCCTAQSDASLTCGLGNHWATCTGANGSSGDRCDFQFPCLAEECCVYDGDGPGYCAPNTDALCANVLVACNPLGPVSSIKQGDQDSAQFCQGGNRNNGRCKAANNCCSLDGYCGSTGPYCETSSASYVWKGGGSFENTKVPSAWTQESNIGPYQYCGSGIIGNGACRTDVYSAEWGVTCCSVNGYCGSTGSDKYGEQFCAGETYPCSCENGVASTGEQGCQKCESCLDGFALSDWYTCVAPVEFSCAAGSFVTQITLSSYTAINAIISFMCSGGQVVQVSTAAAASQTTLVSGGGFCGRSSGYSFLYVNQLTLTDFGTGNGQGPYGYFSSELGTTTTTSCGGASERVIGLKITTGWNFVTYFNILCGDSTASTFQLAFNCPTRTFLSGINIYVGSYVYGVATLTCSDGTVVQVSELIQGGEISVASGSGDYCSLSSGVADGHVTHLQVGDCSGGGVHGPYGDTPSTSAVTTESCTEGKTAVGVLTTTTQSYLTSLKFVCGDVLAPCTCINGTPGQGVSGCQGCLSCDGGFGLSYAGTCISPTTTSCPAGSFVTKIIVSAVNNIGGIASIGCSDGSTVSVDNNIRWGVENDVNSGDGLSGSKGFCSKASGFSVGSVVQLTFTECSTNVESGPFGWNDSDTEITKTSCSFGRKATGVYAMTGPKPDKLLTYFDFVCGDITTCSCEHGTPGEGAVGCNLCISCNSGFGLSSSNTCVLPTAFTCAAGRYVTEIVLEASRWVNSIRYIRCSDGLTVPVSGDAGFQLYTATSGTFTSTSQGYCSNKSGYYSGFVSQLSFGECGGGGITDGPYGYYALTTAVTPKTCGVVNKATGISITAMGTSLTYFDFICGPVSVGAVYICSCVNGVPARGSLGCSSCLACEPGFGLSSSNTCDGPSQHSCPSGSFVTQVTLGLSSWIGISSITCSDGTLVTVSAGVTTAGSKTIAISGDGSSTSSGYCSLLTGSDYRYVSQIKFIECTGSVVDGPFGALSYTSSTTRRNCGAGNKAIGVLTTTQTYLTSLDFLCGPISACNCANGVPGMGAPGCTTCVSCSSDYYFKSATSTCAAFLAYSCPVSTYITQLILQADHWVNGITSITCSDGSVISINAGGVSSQIVASSASTGYCSNQSGLYATCGVSQLKLTECTSGVIDGAYGVYQPTTAITKKTCDIGEQASGVKYLTGQSTTCGSFISYFDFICASTAVVPTTTPVSVPPTALPTAADTFAPTATSGTSTPTVTQGLSTAAPASSTTTTQYFGCTNGRYITKVTLFAGDYVNGVSSITCVDEVISVNAGGTADAKYVAVSGDGSNASWGYCSLLYQLDFLQHTYQLVFTECAEPSPDGSQGQRDGPFGSHVLTPGFTFTTKCEDGQRANEMMISFGPTFISSLSLSCADIVTCECLNGVAAFGPAGCSFCSSCDIAYMLASSGHCVWSTGTPPSAAPIDVTVMCPTGTYIVQFQLLNYIDYGYVDGVTAVVCSNQQVVLVQAGGASNGTPFVATSGDSLSTSPGYCGISNLYDSSGVSQLKLTESGGRIDGPYGYVHDGTNVVSKSCDVGERVIGTHTIAGEWLVYFDIICGPVTALPTATPSASPTSTPAGVVSCTCENGDPGTGITVGCFSCLSCHSGYALFPPSSTSGGPSCYATTAVLCTAGTYISQLQLTYHQNTNYHEWVDGVVSIVCSDSQVVPVQAGGLYGTSFVTTSSSGYCAVSNTFDSAGVSQLSLTECGGGIVDGPFGSFSATTAFTTTKSCGAGERAIGLATAGGAWLLYFNIICGSVTASTPSPSGSSTASPTGVVTCSCEHGNPGMSITVGCSSCSSCLSGYALYPIYDTPGGRFVCYGTTKFGCPTNTYIIQLHMTTLFGWVNGVTDIVCSDGQIVPVHVGQSTGTAVTAISSSGYCSVSDVYNGESVWQVRLTECTGSSVDGPFGGGKSISSSISINKSCGVGSKAVAIEVPFGASFWYLNIACGAVTTLSPTAAPTEAPTAEGSCKCQNGIAATGCTSGEMKCISCDPGYIISLTYCAVWFGCPSLQFVVKIQLSYGDWLNGISSITCSGGQTIAVNVGETGLNQVTASNGDGSISSLGYCAISYGYNGAYVSQLKLTECTGGGVDGAFGSAVTTGTTPTLSGACGTGMRAVGFYLSTDGSSITYFNYGCNYFTSQFSCQAGSFITQITLRSGSWVDGITSFGCSDGSSVAVAAGGTGGGEAIAASSTGYCSASSGIWEGNVSQLKFTECVSSVIDGPYGVDTSGTITARPCNSGERIVGLSTAGGSYVTYFDVVCAPVIVLPTTTPTTAPTTPLPSTAASTPAPSTVPTMLTAAPTSAKPTVSPTANLTTATPTTGPCNCLNGTSATGSAGCTLCTSCNSG